MTVRQDEPARSPRQLQSTSHEPPGLRSMRPWSGENEAAVFQHEVVVHTAFIDCVLLLRIKVRETGLVLTFERTSF